MQGELAGFDAYHKRSKVSYDDGQEEWINLAKERFRLALLSPHPAPLFLSVLAHCMDCLEFPMPMYQHSMAAFVHKAGSKRNSTKRISMQCTSLLDLCEDDTCFGTWGRAPR